MAGARLDPAGVLEAVGLERNMDVIDLCRGDGWFTAAIAKVAKEIASELFGTALLAFLGAGNRSGKFEQAKGGTLFLDEVESTAALPTNR